MGILDERCYLLETVDVFDDGKVCARDGLWRVHHTPQPLKLLHVGIAIPVHSAISQEAFHSAPAAGAFGDVDIIIYMRHEELKQNICVYSKTLHGLGNTS